MVTTLKQKSDGKWYCMHCMMRQDNLMENMHCIFCGYEFTNWEDAVIQDYKDRERAKNESDVHRRIRTQNSVES